MPRTVPQVISALAITAGVILFLATLFTVDRAETLRQTRVLGLALPVVLLPSLGWHLLRAAGWWICFPPESRPSYWRVFRVVTRAMTGASCMTQDISRSGITL